MKVYLFVLVITLFAWQPSSAQAQSVDLKTNFEKFKALYKKGKYTEAIPFAQKFNKLAKERFGKASPVFAFGLNNLAVLYDDQARYADAEPLYKRSLAIKEKALGPDHPDVAGTLNNLAFLYNAQGRYADAEQL